MDRLRAALASLGRLFIGLPRLQQVAIVGAGLAAFAVLGGLFVYAQQPEMVTVFRNVDPSEAAQIVQKLRDGRTPYELQDNGMTIRVPAAQSQQVKLDMAAAGLPKGGSVGYEIFNQGGLGALGM